MIKTTPEGFKILVRTDGIDMFMFDSDRIDEGITYIRKHDIRYIGINSYIGYKAPDIIFLRELRDFVEGITVSEAHYDISVLNELHRLVFLGYADNKKTIIDLSNFPSLTTLACEFSKRLLSLEACEQLQNLTLTGFRPRDKTVCVIPPLSSLRRLSLFVTNISSLSGIGKFPILEELTVYKASHLTDISALKEVTNTLKMLEFDYCKRIGNYEALREATALRKLIIGNSAPIQSLSFVKPLLNLEFFSFVGTNILDGDLSPTIGLKYVGFENKRHYSHTFDEIAGQRDG